MSNFTPKVHETIEYDGDTVTFDLRRMLKEDVLETAPYTPQPDENGVVRVDPEKNVKLINCVIDMLPKYVDNFKGLTNAEGIVVPFDEMYAEGYFYTLQIEMASRLYECSFPANREEDGKNSDASPGEGSTESTSTPIP